MDYDKGYYWVKIYNNSDWCVMNYDGEFFRHLSGSEIFFDRDNMYKKDDLYLIENKIEMTMD
jgi:hypothetical protein